jgi:hypothetical protein
MPKWYGLQGLIIIIAKTTQTNKTLPENHQNMAVKYSPMPHRRDGGQHRRMSMTA